MCDRVGKPDIILTTPSKLTFIITMQQKAATTLQNMQMPMEAGPPNNSEIKVGLKEAHTCAQLP